jgi:hypothetical protein
MVTSALIFFRQIINLHLVLILAGVSLLWSSLNREISLAMIVDNPHTYA